MSKKTTGAENVRWDLSVFYSGISDPQIDADANRLVEMAKNINLSHKGKLSENLDQAISDYLELEMLDEKLGVFLYLSKSTDVANAAIKSKMAEVQVKLSKAYGEYLSFFDIELVALDDVTLEKFYSSSQLVAKHKPWIDQKRLFKPNLLTEPVESALSKRSLFGPSSWSEFFNELESDLEIEFKGGKKTLTEALHMMTESKDVEERAEILRLINKVLGGSFAKYSAQNLYMVAGFESVDNEERQYKHPMEFRNKLNQIPDAVVEMLHKVVTNVGGPLARRYYHLKAAHMGIKTLRWSDRNSPLPFADDTVISFNEALSMVTAAYQNFSPTLADLVRRTIDQKRIDAPAVKGKQSGAYNYSIVIPGNKPVSFTFLNYLGSSRDVMTVAHELGHGGHGLLAGEAQGVLMCHAPMAYAETASVFGEMTTFNFLKKKLEAEGDTKKTLTLVMGKIEDMLNTAVRQIGFSNFERRIHGMDSKYEQWSSPKKYSVEELNAIWLETLIPFYGESGEVFTYENAEHLWSYVSHFHRPFYVYAYSFGELLTQSLYAKQSSFGDRFEPLYLDLLRSGSTKNVVELLKPFDLDPTDEQFWIDGIENSLGKMIAEAEELSESLGVKV